MPKCCWSCLEAAFGDGNCFCLSNSMMFLEKRCICVRQHLGCTMESMEKHCVNFTEGLVVCLAQDVLQVSAAERERAGSVWSRGERGVATVSLAGISPHLLKQVPCRGAIEGGTVHLAVPQAAC